LHFQGQVFCLDSGKLGFQILDFMSTLLVNTGKKIDIVGKLLHQDKRTLLNFQKVVLVVLLDDGKHLLSKRTALFFHF
jgi:hypothetical protein